MSHSKQNRLVAAAAVFALLSVGSTAQAGLFGGSVGKFIESAEKATQQLTLPPINPPHESPCIPTLGKACAN